MSINKVTENLPEGDTSPITQMNGEETASLTNGQASGSSNEVVMLRARCSNLRHWCRRMLEDPASAGVLADSIAFDLLNTIPQVSEAEGQEVVAMIARDGIIPSAHPLAPDKTDGLSHRELLARSTSEWEQLRQAFFKLYDHLYPWDQLTDEYFLEQIAKGELLTLGEVLEEVECEFGS